MKQTISNRQGKQLAVYTDGLKDAPVLVFSNSLGTDHGMWQPQLNELKSHFNVITYDTRGHGESDVISDTTLQNLAEDVVDILDALHIEKAHFCGISMGGITGLWLSIHHPNRFNSITVANSAAKIGQTEAWLSRAESVEKNGLAELVKTTHTRWFSEKFDYQHNVVAQTTIQSLANTPTQGYANACRALAYADLRDEIAQIQIPTLLIAGTEDPVTTVADAEFMQKAINNSQLAKLEASHLSNIEQPQRFTQELTRFIQQI
ncbi:TPA: 3-oxoadipate enol-lactonase [Acinetobacter baumannii]|uniref:3-oxoadipate enol-lactonase n=1 Tax=Acinetobacter baumannii TaxID=470 RepID=UPI0022A41933|nr:3-oxoadipate enol-lactonase [Acinetobacter baumannii]MDC4710828.1 3-oxoadipate enol-lactonase [Acinetobacter baumannii]MDE5410094.1 3-oxoadipate enol-lactonase [Acinetobacter baumannii]MDN8301450.1 3-oxoadipate enol-lactonase [Acinetobacter baumannii]MDV7592533.1 3-oxoadipate enol-lactonase [Acinetobacter baumannii]HCV3309511.1 3-oxoadipate enol-lactonase [Acinetobacter baumannii]